MILQEICYNLAIIFATPLQEISWNSDKMQENLTSLCTLTATSTSESGCA